MRLTPKELVAVVRNGRTAQEARDFVATMQAELDAETVVKYLPNHPPLTRQHLYLLSR